MNPSWKLFAALGLVASFALNPVLIYTATAESKPFHWLFAGKAAAALALNADASRLLDGTEPFVFSGLTFKDLPPGWKAIPIGAFKSLGDVRNALADNTLASDVRGIMYDYERWRFTPEEEQKNPARYVKQAADIVHAYGLLFFTAPAVDLAPVAGAERRPKTSGRDLFAGGHCRRRRPVCRRLRYSIATVRARYKPLRKVREGSCGASASGKSEDHRARRRKYSAEWPVCNSQRHSAGYRRNSQFCRRLLAQHSRAFGILPASHRISSRHSGRRSPRPRATVRAGTGRMQGSARL